MAQPLAPFLWVPVGAAIAVAVLALVLWYFFKPAAAPDNDFLWPSVKVKEYTQWPVETGKGLKKITKGEFTTICAICDTLIPAFEAGEVEAALRAYLRDLVGSDKELLGLLDDMTYYTTGAVDAGVPSLVAEVIETYLKPDQVHGLRTVLKILDQPVGMLFLTGTWSRQGFSKLPFRQREAALRRMFQAYNMTIRGVAQSFKGMVGRSFFSAIHPETKANHTWKTLAYEDRTPELVQSLCDGKAPRQPRLQVERTDDSTTSANAVPPFLSNGNGNRTDVREINCEVVIVGSGAGGGVAAGVLSTAGVNVVVLEKGDYRSEKAFATLTEWDAQKAIYEEAAWLSTEEMSVMILAGSCLGGGTTVNWCASFRTPENVRKEWSRRFGLKSFESSEYDDALDGVCRRLNVNTRYSHRNEEQDCDPDLVINLNNEALWQSAKAVGATCRPVPRNVVGCRDCSGCERGCPYGAKQSTMCTFLEDAQAGRNKARIYTRAYVDKVLLHDGRAVGVSATVKDSSTSGEYKLIVWASKAVITSAGSLHSPALLLRSGLKHPDIGRHIALHPVAAVTGLVPDKKFECEKGVGMGTYIDDFMDMDGSGYGAAIETPPSHAGMTGVIVPWSNAFHYRALSALKPRLAVFIPITRDRSSFRNHVWIDKQGNPRVSYTITKQDQKVLVGGQKAILRMMKAGLKDLAMALPIHDCFKTYRPHRDGDSGFEDYLKYVEDKGLPVASSQIFSAHQMCSNRMAKDRFGGPVSENGETWEVKDLYVMDASVFPTSLGINPMITVESIAFLLSRRLASKLKGATGEAAVADRYLKPTVTEAEGKVTFPDGPTLKGDYGVTCSW